MSKDSEKPCANTGKQIQNRISGRVKSRREETTKTWENQVWIQKAYPKMKWKVNWRNITNAPEYMFIKITYTFLASMVNVMYINVPAKLFHSGRFKENQTAARQRRNFDWRRKCQDISSIIQLFHRDPCQKTIFVDKKRSINYWQTSKNKSYLILANLATTWLVSTQANEITLICSLNSSHTARKKTWKKQLCYRIEIIECSTFAK